MIKGMTLVAPVASMAAFDRLAGLLAALGFEPGKGWQDRDRPRRPLTWPRSATLNWLQGARRRYRQS